jgi:hypothetical protein
MALGFEKGADVQKKVKIAACPTHLALQAGIN